MTPRTAGKDDGFTLVEVLVAVAILGIAFAALLAGMQTSILGSDIHRQQASAGAVLVQAAESIKDQSRNPFLSCAQLGAGTTYNPYTGLTDLPAGWAAAGAVRMVSLQHWNGVTFQATCSDAWPLQRITLSVASPNNRATETVAVVKAGP